MTEAEEDPVLYNPNDTQTCTDAFYRFITEYDQIIETFFFTVTSATRADQMRAIAAHALADEAEREGKTPDDFNKGEVFARVRKFANHLSRTLVTSMVNNLHCYLSDLLQEVMLKKHEVLRSSEQVTTKEILQFSKMSDLRTFLVDRKINDLSYGGLLQMQTFIKDRLGVEMFDSPEQLHLLTVFLELRNIHTHNRGIVNNLFLTRVAQATSYDKRFRFKLGQLYQVDFPEFTVLSKNAITVALSLDERIARKFHLRRRHYKARLTKERENKSITLQSAPA